MFDLEDPVLDCVSLARGMGVAAERADTAEHFTTVLRAARGQRGPFLIEAMIL